MNLYLSISNESRVVKLFEIEQVPCYESWQAAEKGESRGGAHSDGPAPLAGVWGCPPDIIFPPFLARKGVRGMVERGFTLLEVEQVPCRESSVLTIL